jgi:hypothetical protein
MFFLRMLSRIVLFAFASQILAGGIVLLSAFDLFKVAALQEGAHAVLSAGETVVAGLGPWWPVLILAVFFSILDATDRRGKFAA